MRGTGARSDSPSAEEASFEERRKTPQCVDPCTNQMSSAKRLSTPAERRLETEDAVRRSHGGLDVEALDLLPVLGQEGDHEVDGEGGVRLDILALHAHIGDGNSQAQSLLALQLELDRSLLGSNLLVDVLVRAQHGGELAGLESKQHR